MCNLKFENGLSIVYCYILHHHNLYKTNGEGPPRQLLIGVRTM